MAKQTISTRAVIARIRRTLANGGEYLQINRRAGVERYWVCDAHTGNPCAQADDLTELARKIGCLRANEKVSAP